MATSLNVSLDVLQVLTVDRSYMGLGPNSMKGVEPGIPRRGLIVWFLVGSQSRTSNNATLGVQPRWSSLGDGVVRIWDCR